MKETIEKLANTETINKHIIASLKKLLADEFILMNKTTACSLNDASPFADEPSGIFLEVYEKLKHNSEMISAFLKTRSALSLSITEIVSNTSLKNHAINRLGKVAIIENFLSDNKQMLSNMNETISELVLYGEQECATMLKQVNDTHKTIINKYNKFLSEIINPKKAVYDEESR